MCDQILGHCSPARSIHIKLTIIEHTINGYIIKKPISVFFFKELYKFGIKGTETVQNGEAPECPTLMCRKQAERTCNYKHRPVFMEKMNGSEGWCQEPQRIIPVK